MYSARLLDHFERPRHAGTLAAASAHVNVANPACGDVLALEVRVTGGQIAEVAFQAKGCVAAIACASAACELLAGRSLADAGKITKEELRAAVDGVPPAGGHALDLVLDAIQAVLSRSRTSR